MNNTNTPNGDSKDLYSQNIDTGSIELNFLALEERNPEMDKFENDNNSASDGSNTSVVPVEIGTLSTDLIQNVGYVGITVQPLTPSIKKAVENKAKKSQEARENANRDKDFDGIDDRNE